MSIILDILVILFFFAAFVAIVAFIHSAWTGQGSFKDSLKSLWSWVKSMFSGGGGSTPPSSGGGGRGSSPRPPREK